MKQTFTLNLFEKLAIDNANNLEESKKIFEEVDLSPIFWDGIDFVIKNGELVNLQINAQVRKGKSTLGCELGDGIIEKLVKYNHKPKGYTMNINNIVRSQQEYSDVMKRGNLANDFILIDEFDAMDDTGENSSVEQRLREKMSDIFAGLYVHKVSCSPTDVVDKNADLFIEVIATNKERRETLTHIYFNLMQNGVRTKIPIGRCVFSVAKVISRWVEIQGIFIKNYEMNNAKELGEILSENDLKQLNKDNNLIESIRKEDYYVDYMVRKYFKMKLTTKEGIYNSRDLDNAEIILDVVLENKEMAMYTDSFDINMVKAYVDIVARRNKMVLSLIGKKEIIDKSMGILLQYKAFKKNRKQLDTEERKFKALSKDYDKEIKQAESKLLDLSDIGNLATSEIENQKSLSEEVFESKLKLLENINNQILKNISALIDDLKYKKNLKLIYMEKMSK
jgi:hypothetical protein